MSAAQQILMGPREDAEILARYLLARAAEAREDPGAFLEFVMRNEEDHLPLVLSPHQAVTFDFIESHKRGVIMMPRGASKTFVLATYILWSAGNDPSYRCAVVSSIQGQAAKVLKLVRETIETNPMLRLVFPRLARSPKKTDPWTQDSITIARPPGTKDPTLAVFGAYGAIRGSRLKHVFVDDILDEENVNTDESRKKLEQWVDASVLQTIDPKGDTKQFLIGTPLHPEDILHAKKNAGWAFLKMDVVGNIEVQDDVDPSKRLAPTPYWDHALLKVSAPPFLRLAPYPDGENLFPNRWGSEVAAKARGQVGYVEDKRSTLAPWVFQTEHMLLAQDYTLAMCRPEWISACKRKAREMGVHALVHRAPVNGNLRFLGVDLAIKVKEHHDLTAYFAFEVLPTGHRQILWIEYGRYDLSTKLAKVKQLHDAFTFDLILIEDNAAQHLFVEAVELTDMGLPVKGATTGANKAHPEVGLPGLFNEIFRGAWIVPCGPAGDHDVDDRVKAACTAAVNYVPDLHTKDIMMAWWLAYQCCRKWGIGTQPPDPNNSNGVGSYLER